MNSSPAPVTSLRELRLFGYKLITALLPVVILIAALNYYADPGYRFSRRNWYNQIADLILAGKNVQIATVPRGLWSDLNIRLIPGLCANRRVPSVVVWGTSRSSEICQAHFPSQSFFNHAIASGSICDYVALYEIYKAQGQLPEHIIISIDPWTFTGPLYTRMVGTWAHFLPSYDHPPQPKPELEAYFIAGAHRMGLSSYLPRSRTERFREKFDLVTTLLSLTYFQSALKSITWPPPQATQRDAIPHAFVLRQDGSYTLCPEPSKIDPLWVTRIAREYADLVGKRFLSESVMPEEYSNLLDHLLEALTKEGSTVLLYLSPVHPELYRTVTASQPNQIEMKLQEICAKQKVTLIGSFDPQKYQLDATGGWFFDAYHPTRKAIDRILSTNAPELERFLASHRNGR